ncbi:MAG: rRNA maturation RNase YbeY [Rikenellaceae bacterium]
MAISYFHDQSKYLFKNRRKVNQWLKQIALSEGYELVDLGVIFCSSERLLAMNNEFLGHDYFTDIITFDESDLDAGYVAGELYIDVETVEDNATQYNTTPLREMHRILAHGVLHLTGQGDKSEKDAAEMRRKEEHYLSMFE